MSKSRDPAQTDGLVYWCHDGIPGSTDTSCVAIQDLGGIGFEDLALRFGVYGRMKYTVHGCRKFPMLIRVVTGFRNH